jgi:hypothetical protein
VRHLLLVGAGLAVITSAAAVLSGTPLATLLLVGLLLLCPLMMLGMHRDGRRRGEGHRDARERRRSRHGGA